MKKRTALLTAIFIMSSAAVFAQDDQSNSARNGSNPAGLPDIPKSAFMHTPTAMPTGMPAGMPGMAAQRTVIATSDGGIVIVDGNKIMKLNKDLQIIKSVELKNTDSD